MFDKAAILFLYTEASLHAGSGSSVGSIDLPIQRERFTHYPIIQGSGVKGAMRDLSTSVRKKELEDLCKKPSLSDQEKQKKDDLEKSLSLEIMFGPDTDNGNEHAGAISFSDARILLFPVRSLKGVFAWITCPIAIERFKRDIKRINGNIPNDLNTDLTKFNFDSDRKAFITTSCEVAANNKVVLEDYAFQVDTDQQQKQIVSSLANWLAQNALPGTPANNQPNQPNRPPNQANNQANNDPYHFWREKLKKSLVIVSDDTFQHFVRYTTEVIFRIKIGETGTVAEGALWSEERIPSDALFYIFTATTASRKKDHKLTSDQVLDNLKNDIAKANIINLGGDETVGCGLVQAKLYK